MLGLVILLAPVALTLVTDYQLDQTARQYEQAVRNLQPDTRAQQYLAQAHAYNDRLARSGHHARAATGNDPGLADYLATLNAPETSGVIARVIVPSIHVDLPVFHTTNPAVLYEGAGHMYGTDLPVGGTGTTSVISAHTGMVNATMFDELPQVKDGADIFVQVMGQTLRYRVQSRKVVSPTDTSAITYEADKDKLVLLTCTPYGINSDRLLVEAVRVPTDGAQPLQPWRPRLTWWMILDLVVVSLVIVVLVRRERRDRPRAQATD